MKNLKEIFMYSLAALATLVMLTLMIIVFYIELPQANHDIAVMLLGQFMGINVMIYSYFYGSSKGSADKTESVNKAAEELAKNSTTKATEQIETKIN